MRLIGREKLLDFIGRHPEARTRVQAWVAEVEEANWKTSQDIKHRYGAASFLHDNIVVFNIKGNSYRLAAKVNYGAGILLVHEIGTHPEYDDWVL